MDLLAYSESTLLEPALKNVSGSLFCTEEKFHHAQHSIASILLWHHIASYICSCSQNEASKTSWGATMLLACQLLSGIVWHLHTLHDKSTLWPIISTKHTYLFGFSLSFSLILYVYHPRQDELRLIFHHQCCIKVINYFKV